MLTVTGLTFAYGQVPTLRDVSLTVRPGQVKCVLGKNGAGKTTLLHNIMGLLCPSAGEITLAGVDLTAMPTHRRVRDGLALVPQGRQIFPTQTVDENLRVGLEGRADRNRQIPDEIYEHFPILRRLSERRGGLLSGGEQQQLAIARCLVGAPNVLLLDEPTEGVEQKTVRNIGLLLRTLVNGAAANGRPPLAILLVEQNLPFVREFGDYFHQMDRGTLGPERPITDLTPGYVRDNFGI